MKTILTLFGTRPEAIKMAPVILAAHAHENVRALVCATGQHREMAAQALSLFGIKPDHDFNLMRPGQTLNEVFSGVVGKLDALLEGLKPDIALVHGDTTTAAAASLACFHRRIPVGHVEAGLRSFDMAQPFPEEYNRTLIDLSAAQMYAPTETARDNLLREGRARDRIHVTGNTVIDALMTACGIIDADPALGARIDAALPRFDPARKLVLVTAHRRESFGRGFEEICKALTALASRDDVQIVYPVHLNPNVRGPVLAGLGNRANISLIEPLGYLEFVQLMRRAALILTDSGGVQEEAPSLGKPVLVMRDVTERPEAVAAGTVKLVGADAARILQEANAYLEDPALIEAARHARNPYGDGFAARRIIEQAAAA